jgi:hypothetical protein
MRISCRILLSWGISNFDQVNQNLNNKMKKNRIVIILAIVFIVIIGDIILFSNISPSKRGLKKLREAMDIENPITRKFSLQLASAYPGKYNIDQVCKIYNYIVKNWKYVNDPRGLE